MIAPDGAAIIDFDPHALMAIACIAIAIAVALIGAAIK